MDLEVGDARAPTCHIRSHPHEGMKEGRMASLQGTKTEQNLKDAFSGESQANRRYLYFARKADIEVLGPA